MIYVIVVAVLSAAYLLMALMCVCQRESVLSAARLRTERILATLDMEECDYDQSSPISPTANPDVSGLSRATRNASNDDGTHPLAG